MMARSLRTHVRKRVLLATVAMAGLGLAAGGAKLAAERDIGHLVAARGASLSAVDVSLTGRLTLTGLRLPLAGGGVLSIGRVRLPGGPALVSPAFAAEDVVLENISIDAGLLTVRMPRVEATASSLGKAELLAIFDRNASEPLPARLGKLNASRILIPELAITQKIGETTQITTYRDLTLRDIAGGRIALATASGAAIKMDGAPKGEALEGAFGAMSMENFDAVLATRFYVDKAGPDDGALRPVYTAFTADGAKFKNDKGVAISFGRMSGRDFKARPTATPWLETMKLIAETKDPEDLPAAERARFVNAVVDLMEAFDVGSLEMNDFSLDDPAKDKPVTARIARIAFTGGDAPEARLEGFEVKDQESAIGIGAISLAGFSLKPTLQGLREVLGKADAPAGNPDMRLLLPQFGTLRIADVAADVPDTKLADAGSKKGKAKKDERIRMSVKALELTAGQPFKGVPTAVRTAVKGLAFALPANPKEDGLKDLVAMGYKAIDVSFAVDGAWNEPAEEFVVKEISFDGRDMGSIALRGVLGGITKDVFSGDPTVMQVALIGSTAKNLNLTIENTGLFDRVLEREAKKDKRKPEDLRKDLGMGAAVLIPTLLGNSQQAKTLAAAVGRFVAKPGRLEITAKSNQAGGLGLADFMAAGGEASALMDKLAITATAE